MWFTFTLSYPSRIRQCESDSVKVNQNEQCHDPETEAVKWNSAVI